MTAIVEKPKQKDAPSNLAVIGRYVLTPKIFDKLEQTQRGAGGEIQLTDAIEALMDEQSVYTYEFEGVRYDAGNDDGLAPGDGRRRAPALRPRRRSPKPPPLARAVAAPGGGDAARDPASQHRGDPAGLRSEDSSYGTMPAA